MSIELKQAAEKALVVLVSATSFMSRKARDQHESVVAELRAAIQQAEAQQPATGEPVGYMNEGHIHELAMMRLPYGYVYPEAGAGASTAVYAHPAPSVPEFSRIAKRKLDELQKQGFGITGYAIQRGTQRGFITNGGFVGWWRSDEAPNVPDADQATVAGLIASAGHLSSLVDEQTMLLARAMLVMKALHESASPDDGPEMNAIIPAAAFREFVDADAALRSAVANGPVSIDAAMLAAAQAQKGGA